MVTSPKLRQRRQFAPDLRRIRMPQTEITTMDDGLQYAVEFAHDENLLGSPSKVSHLSEILAMLTLNSAEDDNHKIHGKLVAFKREADLLDTQFDSPDYYTQKEALIFKVVCELRGIDHEQWLSEEMGLMDDAAFGHFLQHVFVCHED
ncbi:uncharacterized protein LOC122614164 [Drosophila teissieri]|uniref:uncharacterized protein LOC122614164 n=1 Tax=Drosophila teissieri TaxID=7243 RepID=UPI001CBA5714|nr:uncharacterized protein LOC122614164 [Drosophila teissieri]XP_043644604.1 uncharacterized protein LOC122614164 [Drosophila teissieri]XP_043644615.1 uncharacterized protein LOC122614164 [Drosophila teissieri]XP_043644625.1 uncharacterized protein LOC122614164 [Drosophila teissieri]XP_043644633.1 uncharacterized protein LOC122614164 [Drosophila teissieri]